MFDAYSPSTIGRKTAATCWQPGPDAGAVPVDKPKAAPQDAAPDDDRALVDAWLRDADDAAFEALVARYQRFVFRIALGVLGAGGRQEAEDITQEVFLRLVVHLRDFRGDSTFRTWLRHLATNLAIDRRRLARWRKPHVSLGTLDQSQSPVETADPFKSAASAEEKRVVQQCLQALPARMRSVIHLRYWLDLSADEIAATEQIPNGTVKSRLHRGRRLLHEAMQARGL
jgi:RNA polymerase sigma-70 factor (ECF subfamily)